MKLLRILPLSSLLLLSFITTACVDEQPYSPGRSVTSTKFLRDGIVPPGFESIEVDVELSALELGDATGGGDPDDTAAAGVCACATQECVEAEVAEIGCNLCVSFVCADGLTGGCVRCGDEPSEFEGETGGSRVDVDQDMQTMNGDAPARGLARELVTREMQALQL